jgi:hypothetical protein
MLTSQVLVLLEHDTHFQGKLILTWINRIIKLKKDIYTERKRLTSKARRQKDAAAAGRVSIYARLMGVGGEDPFNSIELGARMRFLTSYNFLVKKHREALKAMAVAFLVERSLGREVTLIDTYQLHPLVNEQFQAMMMA